MINKRLLIKTLLSHSDENSFYDKKQRLNITTKIDKAKFIKHVCALSNSNPENNAYMVVGVEDETNRIIGVDFFDDSKIQNLVNAYLVNPPKIQYENIGFPKLQKHKVIGLVTIRPTAPKTSFKRNAWKYFRGTMFFRRGSNSIPITGDFQLLNTNKHIVASIEKMASNNLELTLDGVFHFMHEHDEEFHPKYRVFKEQFVICWAGRKKFIKGKTYYSRVDIELINEQVRLFYSVLDDVTISYNSSTFLITEFVKLGINDVYDYYPLEKTIINFKDNGKLDMITELLFEPPEYDKKELYHIYNANNTILEKLLGNIVLTAIEEKDFKKFPTTYLICAINGFEQAKSKLMESKPYLKALRNKTVYVLFKESMRILRKVKYQ